MSDEDFAREVGQNVRDARERAGYTQARLSELTGIAVPHLSRLEAGGHMPSLKTVKRVADAMGLTVCELMPPKKPRKRGAK